MVAAADDFRGQLRQQVGYLRRSIEQFDAGHEDEALRIAVAIRVLLHDTSASTSLLTHLGVKDRVRLISTSPGGPADASVMFAFGMGLMDFRRAVAIRPRLGEIGWRLVPADEWWTEVIHVFDRGATRVSRKTMVLGAANKQGGAHVDPKLGGAFKRLAQDGALLHRVTRQPDGSEVRQPLLDIHIVNLRDMAFEIVNSPDIAVLASEHFPAPCRDCRGVVRGNAREPRIVRRNTYSATQCHELECDHSWHVTAMVPSDSDDVLVFDHPCDCAFGEYESRVFRMVGMRHRRFASYAWGKYQQEGRGAVVAWEVDAHRKFDIPDQIPLEPLYEFGYCALGSLDSSGMPTWLRAEEPKIRPAVAEYNPETGYVVVCRHLDGGVEPTILKVRNVPPLPPQAWAERDSAWKESRTASDVSSSESA